MKALILAAGLGTRLRPLTDTVPKPLVPIGAKPLLEYHLESFRKYGFNEVLINTHYLANKIEDFVADYAVKHPEMKIVLTYEKVLLGSAGTVKANQNFFEDEDFLVVYGDNLTSIDYGKFLDFHRKRGGLVTIACYEEPHPESKGIIVFNETQKIDRFIEKPKPEQVVSHYANAGLYMCQPVLFRGLDKMSETPLDFGRDVFPHLLKNDSSLFAYPMEEFFLDIGTPQTYSKAQNEINKLIF